MVTKEQVMDILEKFDFFQGQRAGRELWNDKPFDVQEKDINNFSRDVSLIKEYISDVAQKSEWISVNDDTPKNELERVLVLLEDNDITHTIGTHKIDTDRFVNGKWARWGRWVTHWAPLSDTLKGE